VGATGVDTLIASAGVAKATFYRHFPSKDDLVVAWLRDPRTRWLDRLRVDAEAHATSPDEVIPALFDAVVEWLETDGQRGCPYLGTAIAMPELAEPALAVIRAYLVEVQGYIQERLTAAGDPDADALAPKLQALLMGGMALSVAVGDTNPARAARAALTELLGETPAIPR
ncbi:MAG TPA: TetR/AcrR family transcriptional regulator, partial [Candidatus Limnocylindrales bacterium]|nr:TetR/AcrR family transcriptional regulator [Candidatus Limnocylindrales bacterium]